MSSGETRNEEPKELSIEEKFALIHDSRNIRKQESEDGVEKIESQTKVPMAFQTRMEDYPKKGDLIKIVSYINSNPSLEEEDVPKGTLHLYSPDAKVTPDSIPSSFQYLVVQPIKDIASKPEGYKDSDFDTKEVKDVIDKHVKQYSDCPPSLHFRNVESNDDIKRWIPELGQENAYAGIYKKILPNQRDAKYYIVVQAGAPQACAELKESILNDNNDMTFGELVEDPRLAYVQLLARRNAKRIAGELAFQLKLKIDKDTDHYAYAPTKFMAKPMVAEPVKERDGIQQSVSSIQTMIVAGKSVVGVFHHARPVAEVRKRNYVTSSPYNGITVFNMKEKPLGMAVPVNTGIKTPVEKVDISNENDIARRHCGVIFEPKDESQKYLKELSQEVHHEIDDQFLRGMRQVGWEQHGLGKMFQLIPVVVKVSNVEKKRE
jgi:hypothetical protein